MKTIKSYPFFFRLAVIICMIVCTVAAHAQSATAATPIGIGTEGCGYGNPEGVRELSYNSVTNTLSNTIPMCVPSLAGPVYTSFLSSVAFNPADHLFYYIQVQWNGSDWNSYVFRWDPYTCPGPGLAPYQTYINQFIAGIAFDKNGIGWQINFTGGAPYGLELQRIDFAAGTIGAPQPIVLPPGLNIMQQNGDVEMTPSSQFFAVFDNQLMTINYQNYGVGTINATFINTLQGTGGSSLVGLAYSDGKFLGHLSGSGGCIYQEINILTGVTSPVTTSSLFSVTDFTNIGSSIGLSKALISATPTGTPGVYDIAYNVHVKNFGNVADSNVMITDDLAAVFGAGNISNVSLSWVGSAPSGFTLNGSYDGIGANNMITVSATNELKNFPVAENSFTIRISLRVSGIVAGTVYNNNAVVTATGYRGAAIRDVSTNGTDPDLNSDDKCDDPGEDQPTPFVVSVAPETPPCSSLNTILYNQNFGSGTGLSITMPGTSATAYSGSASAPLPIESFALSNNASNGDATNWINLTDHTGGANGRMLLVNADVLNSKIFVDTVNVQCGNLKYSFFGFVSFIGNNAYSSFCSAFGGFKFPKLTFVVRNAADNSIITNYTTGDIILNSWSQYGLKFVMPTGVTKVIIEIYNAGEGGCGNDLALDDIQFGLCDPQPTISVSGITTGCINGSTTINSFLSDTTGMSATLVYQWQSSTDNITWIDISGATNANLVINPITPADGKYYRLIVAPFGNINSTTCRYISNSLLLNLKNPSVAPTAILKNRSIICPGDPIILKVSGGSLGTNAVYNWYTGSCGGTLIGTGTTITVSPGSATTYYVRAEGDCNITSCASLTITFNCDIDADKDGITDVAESGGVDPKLDDDFDGIPNWRDPDYPGFVDSNGDGVNDNFDSDKDGVPNFLDRDSDNDGIPDVVEAGGVDADGDGKIDNYTDTDNDGLSQNVDANNTGAAGSGVGLGLPDLDGDGIPNYIDLDSDNDGIPDLVEVYGTDSNNNGRVDVFTDTDGDGLADAFDGDVGNDGVSENAANALLRTGADVNNDGRADSYPYKNMDKDSRPNPYDLDSDGDGIADVTEAQFTDANHNGLVDGAINANGWNTAISAMGSLVLPNRDGTGRANVYDIDSDDDGIPDNIEGQATFSYILPSGLDSDGDGIDNSYDDISGFGGKGITPFNMDGDAYPDYLDDDSDGDGLEDIVEGNDFNFNKMPDDNVTLAGTDADDDGLDDHFDNDNTSCKGTSAYMGTGGTTNGDPAPGSITVVQRSLPIFPDRDWRTVEYVLSCDFLSFRASLFNKSVTLQWSVICQQEVKNYIVERSMDGNHFEAIQSMNGTKSLNELQHLSSLDNISNLQATKFYYRIKAIGLTGKIKYTQVVFVATGDLVQQLQVIPNPVKHDMQIMIGSAVKTDALISVVDLQGRVLSKTTEKLNEGSNSISLYSSQWPSGAYVLQVIAGTKKYSVNFIVQH